MYSTKWSVIARQIPGRTDDACSKRYREALDPSLKKGDWTPEEDFHLIQAYQRLGGRWGQIGAELRRSGLGCRNRCAQKIANILFECDIYACRWRLLDRKNMTSDHTHEQSNSSPQGSSTTRAEASLLLQNLWHDSQIVGFSGHMPTTLECSDHRMGAPSSSTQMFRFASSSLSSALSPSISSSNQTQIHLQPDGTPSYLTGSCGSPTINPGNTDIDYENVNLDHHPADPDREATPTVIDIPLNFVGAHSPVRFPVPPNSSSELPSANIPVPNNVHSHGDLPNIQVEVPCVTSTSPASIPPVLSAHDEEISRRVPVQSIPEILVLGEATTPESSISEPATSTKPKRGKNGANYKLSSSLPVTLE